MQDRPLDNTGGTMDVARGTEVRFPPGSGQALGLDRDMLPGCEAHGLVRCQLGRRQGGVKFGLRE